MSFCGCLDSVRSDVDKRIFLTLANLDISAFLTRSLVWGVFATIREFLLDDVHNKPLLYFLQRSARWCCNNIANIVSVITDCSILAKQLQCHNYDMGFL